MPDMVMMNATSSGLTNLATQLPTVGTIGGGGLMLIVVFGVMAYLAHEFNSRNSWLAKLWAWLSNTGVVKAMIGLFTMCFVGACWMLADFLGSSGGQELTHTLLYGVGILIMAFVGLIAVGHLSEPIWARVLLYIFPGETVVTVDGRHHKAKK